MKKNAKILVSGSTGFIGSHLCEIFTKKGIEVIGNESGGNDSSRLLDVTDFTQLLSLKGKIETIIHLAAKTSVDSSYLFPHDTYYTNFVGTLNMLEFARQKKVTRFMYISTYVYGKPKYLPINERHPLDPHSPYNKSKLLAEQLCQFYSHDYGIDVVTLRPFHIYGPRPRANSLIHSILEQIVNKDGKVVLSGRMTKRDFLFVDDFSVLVEKVLKNFPSGYNTYNVGYGRSYSLAEVAGILANLLNRKISVNYDDRGSDIPDIVADRSKISREFNWAPLTELERGLELTVRRILPS